MERDADGKIGVTRPAIRTDVSKLLFLDETWAKTNMTRRYGRSPRGEHLIGFAPYGHWKTTTFLAAVRHDGIVAPLVLDGPINGKTFRAWVEQFLVPTLRPGRHRHRRQFAQPQGRGCPASDRSNRRDVDVSAVLLAGPELDRAGFRQAEGPVAHHRREARDVQPTRVFELPAPLRLRTPRVKPLWAIHPASAINGIDPICNTVSCGRNGSRRRSGSRPAPGQRVSERPLPTRRQEVYDWLDTIWDRRSCEHTPQPRGNAAADVLWEFGEDADSRNFPALNARGLRRDHNHMEKQPPRTLLAAPDCTQTAL
jgi:DDE superfamily endonuclease